MHAVVVSDSCFKQQPLLAVADDGDVLVSQ